MATKDSLKTDVKLATNMVMNAVFADKERVLEFVQHHQQDPVNAAAHAIFVDLVNARSALVKNKLPVDGKIWIAKGGVLDQVVMQTAQLLASNFGKQFASPQFIQGVKRAIVELMHSHETAGGGQGMPQEAPAPDDTMGEQSPAPEDDGAGGGLVNPMQGEM